MKKCSVAGLDTDSSDKFTHLTTNTLPGAAKPIIHADGVVLTDVSGKSYLDLSATTLNTSLGHGFPSVVQATKQQMDKVWFVPTSRILLILSFATFLYKMLLMVCL